MAWLISELQHFFWHILIFIVRQINFQWHWLWNLFFPLKNISHRRWWKEESSVSCSGVSREINYFTISVSFSRRTMWNPMSRTSGHVLTTNIINNTERTVVSTRTLERARKLCKLGSASQTTPNLKAHLVLRNGIRMPAAVAVSKSTTWSIVKTTLINFTTKARAFELSIPSTVNCCWDKCSIFWICNGNVRVIN